MENYPDAFSIRVVFSFGREGVRKTEPVYKMKRSEVLVGGSGQEPLSEV